MAHAAAAILITVTGMLALNVAPAFAGNGYAPCGSRCDGKDPQTYKFWIDSKDPDVYLTCAMDVVPKTSATADNWKIQLRYSPRCETTWIKLFDRGTGCACPFKIKHVSTYTTGGTRKTVWGLGDTDGPWTPMLNDHALLNYGCIYVYRSEDDLAANHPYASDCTDSY
jgi:hypothetical protein